MSSTTALFERLRTIRDRSIDDALADAAQAASDKDLTSLAPVILDRASSGAMIELVRAFHRLAPPLQEAVVEAATNEAQPLREACGGGSPRAALNAVAIIAHARRDDFAYLLEPLLRHGDAATKRAAGRCLVRLAATMGGQPPLSSDAAMANATHGVEEVTERLLGRHRPSEQPFVVTAALALAQRPLPNRFAVLDDARHPAVESVARRVARPTSRTLRRALPGLAHHEPLRGAIREGVAWARDVGKLSDILARSHFFMVQPAAEAVRGCCPDDPIGMPPQKVLGSASRGLPRWLAALDGDASEQGRLLAALHDHPDTMTRLAALRRLVTVARRSCTDPAWEAVASFCRDPNEAIARAAFAALCRGRCSQLPRWLPGLLRDTPEVVRTRAANLMARDGFDRLWNAWPMLAEPRKQAAGRAVLKIDDAFHHALRRQLDSPRRRDVLRALSMVDVLNQTPFFVERLVALAEASDHHIASRAIAVLSTSGNPAATQALDRALDHADGRVRANAVESLVAGRLARHAGRLRIMAWQEENRPQANAVRALLHHDPPGGRDALLSMLRDIRAPHRRSALWVIGAEGMTEMSSRVAEISISDAVPEVRRSAVGMVNGLIRLMHRKPPRPSPTRKRLVGVGSEGDA